MALNDVCRTCLCPEPKRTSIFKPILLEDDQTPITASDLLNMFPRIKISKDDDLPKSVCDNCILNIKQVISFMTQCETSEATLKQLKTVNVSLRADRKSSQNENSKSTKKFTPIKIPKVEAVSEIIDMEDIAIKKELDSESEDSDGSAHMVVTPDVLDHENMLKASLLKTLLETTRPPPPPPKSHHFPFSMPGPMDNSNSSSDELVIIKQEPELDLYLDTESSESGGEDLVEMKVCDSTNFYPNESSFNGRKYRCPTCSEKFSTKSNYEDHLENCLPLLECEVCLMAFSDGPSLEAHIESIHANESQFEIKKGDFNFKILPQANTTSKYKCVVCTIDYGSARNLEAHMRTKHINTYKFPGEEMDRPFVCEHCKKTFTTESRLVGHLRIHRSNIVCEICDKSFRSRHHLRAHQMRIHASKWKTIQCDVCLRYFACNADLVRHQLTHTKEKPYECNACSEKYRYKRFLENHMKVIHNISDDDIKQYMNAKYDKTLELTLNKTFTCLLCSVEVSRSEIGAHMKTHSK